MEIKICTKCKEEKKLSEFRIVKKNNKPKAECRQCERERAKEYRLNNSKETEKAVKKWQQANLEHTKNYQKKRYQENPEKYREQSRVWRANNREKSRESIRKAQVKWKKNNPEGYTNIIRKQSYRIMTDPMLNLKRRLRCRTNVAFKYSKWKKKGPTENLLGCKFETAFQHLESQFVEGMTWDNRNEWHIDHIIPLVSATTEEELIKLCHYTNLQPLWAEDNLRKGSKIIEAKTLIAI